MDTSLIESILKKAMGLNVSSIGNTSLQNAVKKRLSFLKISDISVYSTFLISSPKEINDLIEEVTVTETWFFRDNMPFEAMVHFAKRIQKERQLHKLRILSLPCATGEEPYSIAISLLEAGFSHDSFQIDAVDINSKALDIAKEAIYGNNSFRGKEKEHLKKKYFQKSIKGYSLQNNFKSMVRFHKGNLVNLSTEGRIHAYHIIFCRNLLIYLNKTALTNAINTLDTLLTPMGLLFVGHAEPGIFTNSLFTPSTYQKTFSLVRKGDKCPAPITTETYPDEPEIPLELQDLPPTSISSTRKSFEVDKILTARLLLHKKQYPEAIALCEEEIKAKGPSAYAFFWLANILHKSGEKLKTMELLRQVIYLDPDHLDAMELLRQIYSNRGDTKNSQSIKERISRVRERLSRPM